MLEQAQQSCVQAVQNRETQIDNYWNINSSKKVSEANRNTKLDVSDPAVIDDFMRIKSETAPQAEGTCYATSTAELLEIAARYNTAAQWYEQQAKRITEQAGKILKSKEQKTLDDLKAQVNDLLSQAKDLAASAQDNQVNSAAIAQLNKAIQDALQADATRNIEAARATVQNLQHAIQAAENSLN
ncbi:hypothetical protein [Bifidobacterium dolichotidis]|nr:hypothetical protein [Bifidobacterium dolichotidis]